MAHSQALLRMMQARTTLMMNHSPFFADLAMRLRLREDPTAKKYWTDGKSIGFNPEIVLADNQDEIKSRICEMTMHNAHGHIWRRGTRDPHDWNVACDYALWALLKRAGFAMPSNVLYDAKYDGMSAEQIYSLIHQPKGPQGTDGSPFGRQPTPPSGQGPQSRTPPQPGQQPQQGKPQPGQQPQQDQPGQVQDDDPGSDGEVRDYPGEDSRLAEEEWKVAVVQAWHRAKARGSMPAGFERLIKEITEPQVDWRANLRKWFQERAKNDYAWHRPNRRYLPQGMYMPTPFSEVMPAMVFYWDTSGSRDGDAARREAAAEIIGIFQEVRPELVYVIYGDTKVQRVQRFEPDDAIELKPKGGGGTEFAPIFEYIAEGDGVDLKDDPNLLPIDQPISAFIGITDLEGSFPDVEPEYPVLWVATTDIKPPFGTTIRINQ